MIRIYSDLPSEEEADLIVLPKPKPRPKKKPTVDRKQPAEEEQVMKTTQTEKPMVIQTDGLEPTEEETSAEVLVSSEIEQAVATANELGGDYAAIVAVVLAGIAVLGGKKAWSFYSQKAEQRHELQLKKMEMEQKSSNNDGQSPPACQAVHAKLESDVSAMKTKVGLMEKKLLVMDDFDPEDLERKIKKLTKSVKSLREDLED